MAKHGIRANRRKAEPKATIQAAPTVYEITKPAGSAERFLDDAAKAALAAAAAGGLPSPKQFVPGAIRAVAKEAEKYPDPLLAEAAGLPREELLRRAANAEAYQKAMEAQNEVVRTASTALSPAGNMVANQAGAAAHDALTRQDAKGGDSTGSETAVSETPVSEAPAQQGGPRIVINPTTFHNKKDALCVAFNEGFRVWMEVNGFEPQSEPTDAQRRFFSDTAYADDEVQLRRTILARIATFDTSVKDPTDEQLSETASFLNAVLESDWCKNEWERNAVSRLSQAVRASVGAEPVEPRREPLEAREMEPLQAKAAMGGGETGDEEERRRRATQFAEERGMSTEGFEDMDIQTVEAVYKMHDEEMGGGAAEPSPDEENFAMQNSGQSDQVDQVEEQNLAGREAAQTEQTQTDQVIQAPAEQASAEQAGQAAPAEQVPAEQPGRAIAQRGADGHFHDALGRIVTQRVAQAELDKAAGIAPSRPQVNDMGVAETSYMRELRARRKKRLQMA